MRDRQSEKAVSPALKSADHATPADAEIERNGKRFRVVKVESGTSGAKRSRAVQRRMGRWDPPSGLFTD